MRNNKKVSHTGYVRSAVYKNDEIHIHFFTGMSVEDLFDLKADMGKRWLTVWLKQYEFTEKEAISFWREPEIMQVWNNRWRRMDHYTIVPILHKLQPSETENVYRDMHLTIFDKGSDEYTLMAMGMTRAIARISKRDHDRINYSLIVKKMEVAA